MPTPWKRVYVFVSSTFNDMHAERDYLVKRVFPQLRDWCERRKLRLVDIDLRWGVTEADATHNRNVVKTCLNRIDQCRPFFVCFLGQRRGWVPEPDKISEDTFDAYPGLRNETGKASITEMEILHAIIRPLHGDAPRAKDPEYYEPAKHAYFYLRQPSYLDQLPSQPRMLRETYTNEWIDDLAERAKADSELRRWRDEEVPSTRRPVRHYEAHWSLAVFSPELGLPLHCPSANPQNIERWRDQWARAGVRVNGDDVEADDAEAEKARRFNEQLIAGRLTDFTCEEKVLSEAILRDLQDGIAARYPDHTEDIDATPLQKELDQQEEFLSINSEGFIEREGAFDELDTYLDGDSRHLFVLTAEGGLGKSMLLANWIDRRRDREADAPTFVYRFVGQSDGSSSVPGLLRSILVELQQVHGRIPKKTEEKRTGLDGQERMVEVDLEFPHDPGEIHNFWLRQLPELGKAGKIVFVIDGLNQLESGLKNLYWLPLNGLPENVKIVASFRRGADASQELLDRWAPLPNVRVAQVKPFEDLDDRRKLVAAYLNQYLKELDEAHVDALVRSEGAGNPLFLKVVLSELRVFGAFDKLGEKIRSDFGTTPVSAFQAVLRRLERDPVYTAINPEQAVPMLFGLLAHARRGLQFDELAALFAMHLEHPPSEEFVLDALYLFLRQVDPFLARRDHRYDFFYESFRTAVNERFTVSSLGAGAADKVNLPSARPTPEWHSLLADYFAEQPNYTHCAVDDHKHHPQRRRADELPWQLAKAERNAELESLLTTYEFLQSKLDAFGPEPLICDYDYLSPTRDEPLGLIQGAICLSAHVLQHDTGQLASQLHGRLLVANSETLRDFLDEITPPCGSWLRPLGQGLSPPGGSLIRIMTGHRIAVKSVALTPDGRTAVSGSGDYTVKVWDLGTGALLRTLEGHTSGVSSVATTPDGRTAVSGSGDSTVKVWDLETGALLRTLEGHTSSVYSVAITPDGRTAVSGAGDATLKVWDLATGALLRTLEGHRSNVYSVAITPEGRTLVSGSMDRTVKIWSLTTGTLYRTLSGHTQVVTSVVLTADGRTALSGSLDETFKLWDVETGALLRTFAGHTGAVRSVDITPDGRAAVSASEDRTLKIWDLATGTLRRTLNGHKREILSVALTPDGRIAISGSWDETLRLWDLQVDTTVCKLAEHTNPVRSVALTPDGRTAVSGLSDGSLAVWDSETGTLIRALRGHTDEILAIAITNDGRTVVTGSRDHTVKVWDIGSGILLRTLTKHTGAVRAVAVTIGGQVVSGSTDQVLNIWDLKSGILLRTILGHTGGAWSMALEPSGRTALFVTYNGLIKVCDLDTGALRHTLAGHDRTVTCVALAPDGRIAASASSDLMLHLWDVDSGALLHAFRGNAGQVRSIALAADGRTAVSVSVDKKLKVWDFETGATVATFSADDTMLDVAVTSDGKTIVVGDALSRVHFLRLENAT